MNTLVLDGLLACVLPILAWRTLATDDAGESVALFIAFGLLSAIAWARLDAPDIALVEAAVGTGVTGALLMATLRAIGTEETAAGARRSSRVVIAMFAIVAALGIGTALTRLPAIASGLAEEVHAVVAKTGVTHPVTAVLLDLRGYDTLLEMAVLVVAVLAAQARVTRTAPSDDDPLRPILALLVRMLVPGIVLVAGYLLWQGAAAPGGAFQAAAVLAGGGILAIVAGTIRAPAPQSPWTRTVLVLGPSVFVAVAALPLLLGSRVLEYPHGWAKTLMLAIEVTLTFSIALVLVLFFPSITRSTRPAEARP